MGSISEILKLKDGHEYFYFTESTVVEDGGTYRDYDYLITFRYTGFRCAYVEIKLPTKITQSDIDDFRVHGGITYNGYALHLIGDTLPKDDCKNILLGFDAGHWNDKPDSELAIKVFENPNEYYIYNLGLSGEVRSKEYMIEQCKLLIDQIIEVERSKNV